jgi:hypothetical protein
MSDKYEELKKFVKEYESDTFYGGDLTNEQVTKIADSLIDYLMDAVIDGCLLSHIYDDLFGE